MFRRRTFLPALILVVGGVCSAWLVQGQPARPAMPATIEPPAIRVLTVRPEAVQLRVHSQGTVAPRTLSELVAQVPGQVVEVGQGLEPGAFFDEGEVLLRLDSRDQKLARRRALASLERARAEEEYAEAMLRRQKRLGEAGVASPSAIDEARRAARTASARRVEAEVDLADAEQDLERTTIRAPFDGRTLSRSIDVGRFVAVATPLAELHAIDHAEVRLPIPDSELAFLDLSLGDDVDLASAPRVALTAEFAGRTHRWSGRIVRTEARIDPRTRMVHVVARVPRPYDPDPEDPERPPLAAGLFVEAEIEGRRVDDVVRIPRETLDDEGHLFIVGEGDRLERRRVDVLRVERREALIVDGLDARDRVSLMETRWASDGLAVRPVEPGTLAAGDSSSRPAS